jgi:uncharacterized protein
MRKIDAFNHIWPRPFFEQLCAVVPDMRDITRRSREVPMMVDLDERFRVMDRFPGYQQILSLASPPLELVADPATASVLARIANDSMAELVQRHPDRFPAFVASLPLNDPQAALVEAQRSLEQLGAVGVQVFSNVAGRPLDHADFRALFHYVNGRQRPVWIHPARTASFADYQSEERSLYEIWWAFGWPYETSVALARLVFSRVMDDLPDLKVIAHHAGGMVSFFEGRVGPGWDQLGSRTSDVDYRALLGQLRRRPVEYFRDFYADTATFGSRAAVECALSFFGAGHMLFASDAPFDPERGPRYIRETIAVVDSLAVPEADRRKIYSENIMQLTGIA